MSMMMHVVIIMCLYVHDVCGLARLRDSMCSWLVCLSVYFGLFVVCIICMYYMYVCMYVCMYVYIYIYMYM